MLDDLNESERSLQKRRDAVPWPFRLKEESPEPRDARRAAHVTVREDLDRGPVVMPDEWEIIPDAVDEDIAVELMALRRYYEDSSKELKQLRERRFSALIHKNDLGKFAKRDNEFRDLAIARADALARIQELTSVAEERQREPKLLRRSQDVLGAEVRLSDHDRLEVLLAQKAWDEGAPFVSPRLTGDTRGLDSALRSRAWSLALAQISEMGWKLHTWSANGKIATPLFHRPNT